MSDFHYDASRTGLLLVDPYNDFLSETGKLWPMVKDVADEVSLLDHLRSILAAARAAGIRSSLFPIADGGRAITKIGIIRIQASARCKIGRPSQGKLGR
jgi:nicotinamidase-related amidase